MMGGDLPPDRRQLPDQLQLAGAFQDNRIIPYEGVAAAGSLPSSGGTCCIWSRRMSTRCRQDR